MSSKQFMKVMVLVMKDDNCTFSITLSNSQFEALQFLAFDFEVSISCLVSHIVAGALSTYEGLIDDGSGIRLISACADNNN